MQGVTTVINIKDGKSYDVYIGRAGYGHNGYFGNPYRILPNMTRGDTIENYRRWFEDRLSTDHIFKKRILELKGKTLGCFCKPHACHGDIIKQWLDQQKD